MWRNWAAARTELGIYLAENADNSAVSARARFYLAQCNYFTGDIKTALTEFLKLQQIYPDETSIWIQSCLNRLAER
jgi:TolA-binding protein